MKNLISSNKSTEVQTSQPDRQGFPNYPAGVQVKGSNVFLNGRYLGYVDKIVNWGTYFLARCEHKPNQFFRTKTEAVLYMASPVSQSSL